MTTSNHNRNKKNTLYKFLNEYNMIIIYYDDTCKCPIMSH